MLVLPAGPHWVTPLLMWAPWIDNIIITIMISISYWAIMVKISIYTWLHFNPFTPNSASIDFTLSNARLFYSSRGHPLGVKGLITWPVQFSFGCKISVKFGWVPFVNVLVMWTSFRNIQTLLQVSDISQAKFSWTSIFCIFLTFNSFEF